MINVSDDLYGPYSETRLLLRNGGHNDLFVDKDGNVWTTLFAPTGQHGSRCKPAIVMLSEDERGILFVPTPDGEDRYHEKRSSILKEASKISIPDRARGGSLYHPIGLSRDLFGDKRPTDSTGTGEVTDRITVTPEGDGSIGPH